MNSPLVMAALVAAIHEELRVWAAMTAHRPPRLFLATHPH